MSDDTDCSFLKVNDGCQMSGVRVGPGWNAVIKATVNKCIVQWFENVLLIRMSRANEYANAKAVFLMTEFIWKLNLTWGSNVTPRKVMNFDGVMMQLPTYISGFIVTLYLWEWNNTKAVLIALIFNKLLLHQLLHHETRLPTSVFNIDRRLGRSLSLENIVVSSA